MCVCVFVCVRLYCRVSLPVICKPLKLCKVIPSAARCSARGAQRSHFAPIFAIVNVISGCKCELHLSKSSTCPCPSSLSLSPYDCLCLSRVCCMSKYLATLSDRHRLPAAVQHKLGQLNGQPLAQLGLAWAGCGAGSRSAPSCSISLQCSCKHCLCHLLQPLRPLLPHRMWLRHAFRFT